MVRHLKTLFAVLLLLPFVATSAPKEPWPDTSSGESLLIFFGISDTVSIAAGNCAVQYDPNSNDASCSVGNSVFVAGRDLTITRVSANVGSVPWATTEACDVDVYIDGTEVAGDATEFALGGESGNGAEFDLNEAFQQASRSGLSIQVNEGQQITVEHNEPVPDDECVAGGSCVCNTSTASYGYEIWARPR